MITKIKKYSLKIFFRINYEFVIIFLRFINENKRENIYILC